MFTKSKIKKITPLGRLEVCDITVEDDHSYVANGIVNHNSSANPNMQNIPRDCVEYNTMLITNKGLKKIGELVPSFEGIYRNNNPLQVLTHTGEYKDITHWVNKGEEEMVEIEFDNGSKISCTLAHRLLTTHYGWKTVDEIIKNDYECRNIED